MDQASRCLPWYPFSPFLVLSFKQASFMVEAKLEVKLEAGKVS